MSIYIQLAYLLSATLFILGIKGMSSAPETARRGMNMAAIGMFIAIVGTLLHRDIVSYRWIIAGIVVGSTIGALMSLWIPMTAVPQRTALSHAGGALAAALIGVSEYYRHGAGLGTIRTAMIGIEVMVGGLTVTGSLMAAAKLQGLLPGRPITYRGQNFSNFTLLTVMLVLIVSLVFVPAMSALFYTLLGLAFTFGVLLVLPIGAADMPVVIALLNSYAGLTDAAMGFMLDNRIQIITGALDGASGFILSILMCKAMNRSITNVLFGAFGQIAAEAPAVTSAAPAGAFAGDAKPSAPAVKKITAEKTALLFRDAKSVIVVPGYGMAAAQAQHAVGELASMLKAMDIHLKFAIHPVAGRMPGHMNVLLAEAGIPYTDLIEMEEINPEFEETDIALVIGANDTTNPAARHDRASPIYGMPILDVDKAKNIIVCKRGMAPGFAGIDNELYLNKNTRMLFGDAKDSITKVLAGIKDPNLKAAPTPVEEETQAGGAVVRKVTPEETVKHFKNARSVIVVPGYGMAAAQAQHAVGELAELLKTKGVSVKFGIHPVAGRMPGHMNVLLAEAGVPYTDLVEMEEINPEFEETDIALVIGANDTTNPAARHNKTSPIYGMPILDVDKSRLVIVCKRSMAPGFAGIDNELYLNKNTRMLFGDARDSISKVVQGLK
ncbi:MAG: NAD(P)(+) transhydrogenase (Re/Si-specific) subunit beta [Deltaproteobacteria bacterium]|nr:NAD(P)(+) transhydrogenase (Re/Si-specific) subunit beta [Deltaproteobacteria bacterium]